MTVIVYGKDECGLCVRALTRLQQISAHPVYINLSTHPECRAALEERAPGFKTVPQIFIGDRHIGGHDELMRLSTPALQAMFGGT